MSRCLSTVVSVIVLVLISATPLNVVPQAMAQVEGAAVHIVVETNPEARYRREGWSGFSTLSLGKQLGPNDLIDPGGAPVRVLCADLTELVIVEPGPVPCPADRPILVQGEGVMAAWEGGAREDLLTPFLITPRNTFVLSRHPLIRWNPVPDVDGYLVIVRKEGQSWETDVEGAEVGELVYPDDAPVLEPDIPYQVEVITIGGDNEGRSSAEENVPMSFAVMEPGAVAEIVATVGEIREHGGQGQPIALATAHYYAQNDLRAEALTLLSNSGDLLRDGCPTGSEARASSVTYLMLGDLYMQTQLERHAGAAYGCAFELAAQTGDLEAQALSLTGLARLSPDRDMQTEYVGSAIGIWEQLGAWEQIEALEEAFG